MEWGLVIVELSIRFVVAIEGRFGILGTDRTASVLGLKVVRW
jgi:hypothetical protein